MTPGLLFRLTVTVCAETENGLLPVVDSACPANAMDIIIVKLKIAALILFFFIGSFLQFLKPANAGSN